MNIQYLNHPPYPNRWMIALIQQGSVSDLGSSEPGCQEDDEALLIQPLFRGGGGINGGARMCPL